MVLACWEPLGFAAVAGAAPTLIARGPVAIAEFIWAAAVAALSVAAAWALWSSSHAAVPLARAAIVIAVARDLQVLTWTALPSNIAPGTRPIIAAGTLTIFAVIWAMTTRLRGAR